MQHPAASAPSAASPRSAASPALAVATRAPRLALMLFAALVALLVFADTWRDMAAIWWGSDTFGHGLLVAPIAAWLLWRERRTLAASMPRTSWSGGVALALACAIWLVARLAGVEVLAQFAATATLPALVLALLGPAVARALAFPLGFLFFMVPAGESLNLPLMHATADATIAAVRASGIPVHDEGLHFTLPTGRWSVVEACSGLRYVLASALLASLFAHLQLSRARDRVLFVAAAVVVAVLANWVRAWAIVMIGHFSGMRWAVGDDHVVYGWVFYGLVMVIVFRLGMRWRDTRSAVVSASGAGGREHAVPPRQAGGASEARARGVTVAVLVTFVLVASPLTLRQLRDVPVPADVAARMGSALGAFTAGRVVPEPHYAGSLALMRGRLAAEPGVDVFVAYFARQHESGEMIGFGNAVLPDGSGWQLLSREAHTVVLDGVSVPVHEWRIRSGDAQRLLWSWFTVAGVHVCDEPRAKALTAWAMLRGRGDPSTVNVLATALPPMPTAAPPRELAAAVEVARQRLVPPASAVRHAAERATGR